MRCRLYLLVFALPIVGAGDSARAHEPLAVAVQPGSNKSDLPEGVLLRIGSKTFLHGGKIQALAYSPDGKIIASAAENWKDPTIRLFDAESGKEIGSLKGHKGNVSLSYFSPPPRGMRRSIPAGRTARSVFGTSKRRLSCRKSSITLVR